MNFTEDISNDVSKELLRGIRKKMNKNSIYCGIRHYRSCGTSKWMKKPWSQEVRKHRVDVYLLSSSPPCWSDWEAEQEPKKRTVRWGGRKRDLKRIHWTLGMIGTRSSSGDTIDGRQCAPGVSLVAVRYQRSDKGIAAAAQWSTTTVCLRFRSRTSEHFRRPSLPKPIESYEMAIPFRYNSFGDHVVVLIAWRFPWQRFRGRENFRWQVHRFGFSQISARHFICYSHHWLADVSRQEEEREPTLLYLKAADYTPLLRIDYCSVR